MQILSLVRISALPSARRILNDYTFTRKDNPKYKMITTASFVALSLVKRSTGDVAAVCLDRKPDGVLCVEFSLNDATAEVLVHAERIETFMQKALGHSQKS